MSIDDTKEFENQLREFVPVDPPAGLRERILEAAAAPPLQPVHWGWKVAAALLVGGSIAINTSFAKISFGESTRDHAMRTTTTVGRSNLGEEIPYPQRFACLPRLPKPRAERPGS